MSTENFADTEIALEQKVSPMMLQWHACKKAAGDALLFFRMGDFYEAFHEDAAILARELDLTLTKRQDIPMSGVPHHACEGYIDKLVSKGYRVAVAEQTADPKQCKGIVPREVVRYVTSGTLINSSLLSDKTNNYFACLSRIGSLFGLALVDLTTAEFQVIEFDRESDLLNELYRIRPAEVLASPKFQEKHKHLLDDARKGYHFALCSYDDWHFEHQTAYDYLVNHFKVQSLDGFGLKGALAGINAAGALLSYLQDSLCFPVAHLSELHLYSTADFMVLDRATQRNLELTESLQDGSRKNTLLEIMDKTRTPMGGRLLRHWIKQPLLDPIEIAYRQDAVQAILSFPQLLDQLCTLLEGVRDIERLIIKVCSGYASPRDLVALRYSLEAIPLIKQALQSLIPYSSFLETEEKKLEPLPELTGLIASSLVDDPPARISDGKLFRDGYCQELDELREISRDSKAWLSRYQANLRESTGIKTIKVGYNKMFGYFIEVSKGQADRMPDIFERRQTLVNAERYITPELKEYESKVLHAEERMQALENELFISLRLEVAKYGEPIQHTAQAVAKIDTVQSLASAAHEHSYIRPFVDQSPVLRIDGGRHPVIEAAASHGRFIPNDTFLDDEMSRLLLITGPNMAGKSTYIRQVALITIMAQMGSFVPAQTAQIGIVDKVFTRIGASDDLARGQSTFMVEMTETANILNNATSRSLVILDEIGRGTSTYDGISIAWAVAEYLLITEGKMAKTLFATHYWELTKLEEKIPGAVNYNVAVHESDEDIVFLRKIVRGGTDKSYGIHVGRLAGLPGTVITRAKEILVHLEENANRKSAFEPSPARKTPARKKTVAENDMQLTFFG